MTAFASSHTALSISAGLGVGAIAVATVGLTLGSSDGAATAVPPASTTAATSTTTLPLSPLNAQLGDPISVIPSAPTAPPSPVGITIDAIGLASVPVRAVGLDADGQLEIPDETEVGWYRHSSWPGRPGATVLAAHVSWNDATGPFYELVDVQPGSAVSVQLADGTVRSYTVVERQQYPKTELPADRIWTTVGPETLVLITCGGEFNPEIRRYRHNIVVYAVPTS